jgi:flavin reductase (DIM6/NTAB) family NADH-FMN oxidoreductase RutF
MPGRSGPQVRNNMKKSLGAKTIIFPTPAWVIGTYDREHRPNAMTIAWGGICCSMPPCVGISLRRATYSYDALMERRAFTVNVPSEEHVPLVDYFGIASGRKEDKLAAAGLTPVKADFVDAPFIAEFPLVLECKVIHITEIGLHTHFVGEIIDVKAEESVLGESGVCLIEKVRPLIYSPEARTYHGVGTFLAKAFSIGKKVVRS